MEDIKKVIEHCLVIVHQMKNKFLGDYADQIRVANEVTATVRKELPMLSPEHKTALGIITFQLVRLAMVMPEELASDELVVEYEAEVQKIVDYNRETLGHENDGRVTYVTE